MKKDRKIKGDLSRRGLLKSVLYSSPLLLFKPGGLFADGKIKPLFKPKIVPKGQTIRLAHVGCSNRGGSLLKTYIQFQKKNRIKYVAVCDVNKKFAKKASKNLGDVPYFQDYRKMFEKMHEEFDAVVVGIPDHAHFTVSMHAMLLGKHVYVEKPIAHSVLECRLLEKTARACNVVTQMGNQGHSKNGTFMIKEFIKQGVVKNVTKIDAWMNKDRRWHPWNIVGYEAQPVPREMDWDLWLTMTPFRPYTKKLDKGNWRSWYEFGCGCMGDWGAHIIDGVHEALKLGSPSEIEAELIEPNKYVFPKGSTLTFKFPARGDMPPVALRWFDGVDNKAPDPPGELITYEGSKEKRSSEKKKKKGNGTLKKGSCGLFIYAEDMVLQTGTKGSPYYILPYEKMKAMQKERKLPKVSGESDHYENYLDAINGEVKANSRFEVSAPLGEILCLGCIAQRYGGKLIYDAENMKITNNPEADKMLHGPVPRKGWENYYDFKVSKSGHTSGYSYKGVKMFETKGTKDKKKG